MEKSEKLDIVRERLLDKAEALFSSKGYSDVTVREITAAAHCNIASVNYYFGSKRNLYLEVFRSRWIPRAFRVQDHFHQLLENKENPSRKDVVHALAEAFLAGPLSDEERMRHHQLMSREMTQPSEALQLVVEQVMRPFFKELADQLRPRTPGDHAPDSNRMILDMLCIFSMVLYFNFARTAVSRITGRAYDASFKSEIIRQITAFSMGGLNGSSREPRP